MTDRELMQQALDALDLVTDLTSYDDEVYEAIDALRARLAQPESEWQGLTDEELREVVGMPSSYSDWNPVVVYKWLHAIEAKLKEKNT